MDLSFLVFVIIIIYILMYIDWLLPVHVRGSRLRFISV